MSSKPTIPTMQIIRYTIVRHENLYFPSNPIIVLDYGKNYGKTRPSTSVKRSVPSMLVSPSKAELHNTHWGAMVKISALGDSYVCMYVRVFIVFISRWCLIRLQKYNFFLYGDKKNGKIFCCWAKKYLLYVVAMLFISCCLRFRKLSVQCLGATDDVD